VACITVIRPFNYKLHAAMQANSDWRIKWANGSDHRGTGDNWLYNLSNPACRQAWVAECVAATAAGCTGCFIDQANDKEMVAGNTPAGRAYSAAHLATLVELSETLARTGKYAIMNHLGDLGDHVHAMMVEDFVGSERCVRLLQTLAARGFAVQAHAGDLPTGKNYCVDGDTNSMAAFLVGAGEHHYYHCAGQPDAWGSNPLWPAVKDAWLDWLPEYDYKVCVHDQLTRRVRLRPAPLVSNTPPCCNIFYLFYVNNLQAGRAARTGDQQAVIGGRRRQRVAVEPRVCQRHPRGV